MTQPLPTPTWGSARLIAGVPSQNNALFHKIQFLAGDPAAWVELGSSEGTRHTTLIIRDIEIGRAARDAQADEVVCPADLVPTARISGERDVATAQAVAELLLRNGIHKVTVDRTLPFLVAVELEARGIRPVLDPDLGVRERRAKSEHEVECLRQAQAVTERAMVLACRMVATAKADHQGQLHWEGAPLTSERVRVAINQFLLQEGFEPCNSIVAGGPQGGDCHALGSGTLWTEQPVIIDIFPRNAQTRFFGDCTRTVVNGCIPDPIARMHRAVCHAKRAAERTLRAGVGGGSVHAATIEVIHGHGFESGFLRDGEDTARCAMVHGTGHGVGLDVHEAPLLDQGGPMLVEGDAVTIEPGLYQAGVGGVRVEDLYIVQASGSINLNQLPEQLGWS